MTGRLQRDIGYRAGLTHDENLHPLRYLTSRQHRRVHHLPVLKRDTKHFLALETRTLQTPIPIFNRVYHGNLHVFQYMRLYNFH